MKIDQLSLAPELKDSDKLIEYLVKEGVVVSIGHTNATYDEAVVGIKAGATSGTHTYNAMTPLTHRNPGVVGAIMEHDEVYAELINELSLGFNDIEVDGYKVSGFFKMCNAILEDNDVNLAQEFIN